MQQEDPASFGFVGFADHRGHLGETAHAPQEPAIGGLRPPHVSASPPPVGTQRVEAPVIAHAIGRIAVDRVATEITERRPAIEKPRV